MLSLSLTHALPLLQARMVDGYKRLDRSYSQAIRAAQESSAKAEKIRSQPMDEHVSMLLRSKEETDALRALSVPKQRASSTQPLSTAPHVSWKAVRPWLRVTPASSSPSVAVWHLTPLVGRSATWWSTRRSR